MQISQGGTLFRLEFSTSGKSFGVFSEKCLLSVVRKRQGENSGDNLVGNERRRGVGPLILIRTTKVEGVCMCFHFCPACVERFLSWVMAPYPSSVYQHAPTVPIFERNCNPTRSRSDTPHSVDFFRGGVSSAMHQDFFSFLCTWPGSMAIPARFFVGIACP